MPKQKGQINRLSKGNWQIRIQGTDENGKRKSKSLSGYTTRDDAEDALKELLGEIEKARKAPRIQRRTFKQLFDAYLEIIKPKIREQSYNLYETLFTSHLSSLDNQFLDSITAYDIEKLFADQMQKYSGTTLSKPFSLLKASLKKARQWKWVTENVCDDVTPPKKSTEEKTALTLNELNSFIDTCSDGEKAFWLFFGLTGCRAQEVCGAKWKYLDWEAGTFLVKEVLVQNKNAEKFQKPKTPKSIRTIPLEDELLAILKKHRVGQNKLRLSLGSLWTDYDLIFPKPDGTDKRMANLWLECEKIRKKAGIGRKVTPHIFRHSAATLAIKSGMELKAVSDLLGHSNTNITSRIYTHLGLEDKAKVTNKLTDLVLRRKIKAV